MKKNLRYNPGATAFLESVDLLLDQAGDNPKMVIGILRNALTDEPRPKQPKRKADFDAWLRGMEIRRGIVAFLKAAAARDTQFFSTLTRICESKSADCGIDEMARAIAVQKWFDESIGIKRTRPEFQSLCEDHTGEAYHRQTFVRAADRAGVAFVKAKRGKQPDKRKKVI